MALRAAAAILLVLSVLLAGYLFRPTTGPSSEKFRQNDRHAAEHETAEPVPAPILFDAPGDARPVALVDAPEPVAAPLPQSPPEEDVVLPSHELIGVRPKKTSHMRSHRASHVHDPQMAREPAVSDDRGASPPHGDSLETSD